MKLVTYGKAIINHPQNHHKWVLQTINIRVVYCFINIIHDYSLVN